MTFVCEVAGMMNGMYTLYIISYFTGLNFFDPRQFFRAIPDQSFYGHCPHNCYDEFIQFARSVTTSDI